jgi:hypothetical protein
MQNFMRKKLRYQHRAKYWWYGDEHVHIHKHITVINNISSPDPNPDPEIPEQGQPNDPIDVTGQATNSENDIISIKPFCYDCMLHSGCHFSTNVESVSNSRYCAIAIPIARCCSSYGNPLPGPGGSMLCFSQSMVYWPRTWLLIGSAPGSRDDQFTTLFAIDMIHTFQYC